jgi:hypothetical protein
MSNELIFVLIFFWVVSAAYVMYTDNKSYTLSLEIIIGAILLGPILALFVRNHEHKIKKHHYIEENENDTHRKWFQLHNLINRERTNNIRNNTPPHVYSNRTIPPLRPISRVERHRLERDEAIRLATERIDKNKLKDFKFLRG